MMNTKMLYHDFLLKSVRLRNVNISNTPQFFILKCIWSLGTGRDWTSPHLLEACLGEQLQRTWALGREGRTDAPSTPEPGHRGWGQVAGDSGAYPADSRPRAILFALRPRPCGCQTPGPARGLPLPGQKRSPRCCRRSLCVASSLCGGGGETWEQGLRPAPGAAKAGREPNVSEGQQLSATNCACTRVPAIVCPGGGSVGDPKSGRSGLGRPPEVSRAGPPASHSFAVPTAPRAGERTMASMRAFDGRLPLCLCLCVSWHLCLCESLAHSCFPTSFPSPRGAELGGPGSGNGTASCSHQGQ